MNNFKKVGLSALAGSLAAFSAQAAEVSWSGDSTIAYTDNESNGSDANSALNTAFSADTGLSVSASGELDNGWTVDLSIAHNNDATFSAAVVDLGMGGLGNLMINQGDGNGLGAYDDKMPTAWEEPWGAGLNPDVQLVGGIGSSMNVQYTTPKVLGTTVVLAYAPETDDAGI